MLRVLLVDDDEDLRFLTEMALEESGYDVVTVSCGRDAVSLAHSDKFDVVLLDALMPEMDGFEVHRKLKADAATREIPIIFLTGQTPTGRDVDFILKPYDPDRIGQQIEAILQKTKR